MGLEQKLAMELREKWGDDNIPHNESYAFDEPMIEELGIRRCRSFRAEICHKLNIIARAAGTWDQAARWLNATPFQVREWRAFRRVPGSRNTFAKIDSVYESALEMLKIEARKTKALSDNAKARYESQRKT